MYFEEVGEVNSEKTVELALAYARENDIRDIVVSSHSGDSVFLLEGNPDLNIVWVTAVMGYKGPGENFFTEKALARAQEAGIKILTTSHVLSGVERGISSSFGGLYPAEIMSHTLRIFGQGVKVGLEIAIMTLDAGLVPYGQPIIAIGGTSQGVDTAILVTPSHAQDVFKSKIHRIICKPQLLEDK